MQSIWSEDRAGPIAQMGEILKMLHNGNLLSVVQMAGKELLQLLETSMEAFNDRDSARGEFLHVSGYFPIIKESFVENFRDNLDVVQA